MSSRTKVSPKIRDHVPPGFYVDHKTQDVRLQGGVGTVDKSMRRSAVRHPLYVAKDAAHALAMPRSQEKRSHPSKHQGRPLRILLVEDNPGDARLVREALLESKLPTTLDVIENGAEALSFLRRQGKYISAPRPDLILLDLNLPLKDGREVLRETKQDPDLRRIPVVVLTSSRADQDILKTYDLHANCYIRKRMELDQFITVIQLLQAFWCHIVQLPPEETGPPTEIAHAND
ncbi:MAG TPA: response regulator [Gemmataceae bacterium]|nr:response regulator [Gemmataceae bacterium]